MLQLYLNMFQVKKKKEQKRRIDEQNKTKQNKEIEISLMISTNIQLT